MSNRFWAKTSLVASVIALGVSIIALANRCPTESATGHISFDYMGVILGILALLVTALIGAQVGQYIFVDRKIEDTAGKIARIIAHKSANNMAKKTAEEIADSIARETASNVSKTVSEEIANKAAKDANDIARKTAEKAIKDLAKDTTIIAHGKEKMKNVPNLMMFGEYIKSIDDIIEAINIFKTCSYSTISEPVIEDALLSLDKVFEDCLKQEVPRYLKDKRDYYISVLEDVHNSRIEKYISYLQYAKGYPASIDYDIREAKDKKELEAKLRGGKSD